MSGRYQEGFDAGYKKAMRDFTSDGYAVVPTMPTPQMIAAALPIVENFQDDEIAAAKEIGSAAVLLLSPPGRPHGPIDKRAAELAAGMVCDYRRMIAAVEQDTGLRPPSNAIAHQ